MSIISPILTKDDIIIGMTAEIEVRIGKSYPGGNLRGEKGKSIFLTVEPTVQYFEVVGKNHTSMEFDPRTGKSTEIKFPQF